MNLTKENNMDTKELLIQLLLEKHVGAEKKEAHLESEHVGKICMVRTYSAGVFYGLLEKKVGKEGLIRNARRVWYWKGAASLSQLVTEGTKNPSECRFPCAVDSVELSEIIETIPMTQKAIESLNGVPVWQQ
jgi:hypothetical protein